MKTTYRYIRFTQIPSGWRCNNIRHGEELGAVRWDVAWKQWVYEPSGPAIYSTGCLTDIQHFMDQLPSQPAPMLAQEA